jgi:hypothetical protein
MIMARDELEDMKIVLYLICFYQLVMPGSSLVSVVFSSNGNAHVLPNAS